jgi:L-malate glycosyltransferase
MNAQEFSTQISANPKEKDLLEIFSASRPLKKVEGLFPKPLDFLRSSHLENPYLWNALLQDFADDHYSFRPYIKALKGLEPGEPKGPAILSFLMALSIEVEEPLIQPRILYPFRHYFKENTEESFRLYCYLHYFSLPLEGYPGLEKYRVYTKILNNTQPMEHFPEQFSLMQFLFQGNPLQLGKGDSGGLSTFLLQLGKALTHSANISQVITLSLRDISKGPSSYRLLKKLNANHYLLTIPFYMGDDPGFVKNHSFLKAIIAVVLKKLQLNPNIYHIRYLNDASLAMARLGKEKHRSVVLTLTPDPHRSMVQEDTLKIIGHQYKEGIEKIHKIEIGKKLLHLSDGVVGIGGENAKERLLQYFPEVSLIPRNKPFQMLSEGIDVYLPSRRQMDIKKVLTSSNHRYAIATDNLSKPYILNVGRLHPLKGQQRLLQAFYTSGAYKKYNLVIIGGSLQNPNKAEAGFLDFEREFLKKHPELLGNYGHIPGIPNSTVRLIEKKINAFENSSLPNIYFCASEKEEFGIAILEAMVEGFIPVGPKVGGVSGYITHGKNGFLGDTKGVSDIEQSLREVMRYIDENPEDIKALKISSRNTIKENYSMEAISLKFEEFYREVLQYGKP